MTEDEYNLKIDQLNEILADNYMIHTVLYDYFDNYVSRLANDSDRINKYNNLVEAYSILYTSEHRAVRDILFEDNI